MPAPDVQETESMRQLGQRLFDACQVGAHLYCFTDWRQYGNVVTSLETVRWTLRSCVVWSKNRGGAMGSFWRNDHELVPVFSKGNPSPLPDGSYFNEVEERYCEIAAQRLAQGALDFGGAA